MKVYICGAVKDILTEFQAKLERFDGVEVIAADEMSSTRGFDPPLNADAAVIGIDQSSHGATNKAVLLCKARELPYAMGELRKWSFMYPRLIQAGILKEGSEPVEAPEEETMAATPVKLVQQATQAEDVQRAVFAALTAVKRCFEALDALQKENLKVTISLDLGTGVGNLEWDGCKATLHYADGKAYAEADYQASMKVSL